MVTFWTLPKRIQGGFYFKCTIITCSNRWQKTKFPSTEALWSLDIDGREPVCPLPKTAGTMFPKPFTVNKLHFSPSIFGLSSGYPFHSQFWSSDRHLLPPSWPEPSMPIRAHLTYPPSIPFSAQKDAPDGRFNNSTRSISLIIYCNSKANGYL